MYFFISQYLKITFVFHFLKPQNTKENIRQNNQNIKILLTGKSPFHIPENKKKR